MNDIATPAVRLPRTAGRNIFGADVAGYHDARADYPPELYRALWPRLPSCPSIAEIGAGTGLATEALFRFAPSRFVAFEPDVALASALHARFAALDVVEDDFCAGAVDPGFDLIAAASSFHWLEPEAALARARALIEPGGCLALWWNVYRQPGIGDPFAEAVLPLLDGIDLPPSEGPDGHYGLDVALHRARLTAAGFVEPEFLLFRRERRLTPAMARALYASFSMVRLLSAERRTGLLDAIERIVVDRFAGSAPSVVLTPLYLATAPAA